MLIAVVIWMVSAVLCALIAKDKERDVGTFVVIGLLFGVFGILYAVAARSSAYLAARNERLAAADARDAERARKADISADLIRKI